MEKKSSKMLLQILNDYNVSQNYEWRIEDYSGEKDTYISVYPDTCFYSCELSSLVCIANSFRASFWVDVMEDLQDNNELKPVFHFA